MKSKFTMIKKTAIAVIMLILFMTCFVSATEDAYVTENDPLVSLSYIKNVFEPEIKDYVDLKAGGATAGEVANMLANDPGFRSFVEEIIKEELNNYTLSSSGGSLSSVFAVLNLSAGQKVTALGKCEIIMQKGACTVFGPGTSSAVKDLSAGKTLNGGSALTVGNFVEISYADGSGIAAVKAGTSLLIRGEYSIAE